MQRRIKHALGERGDYPIPSWHEWSVWEPTVQFALRDLCRPRDTVIDVGANAGAIAMVMSRLVGLDGRVYAFEASQRIVGKTQYNLAQQGCGNTQVFHNAVFSESGKELPLWYGADLNDSVVQHDGAPSEVVKTVALDDFCAHWGISPRVIKMDIEGAEYDALLGMPRLIAKDRPHLILEQQQEDMRCFDLLTRAGYRCIDLGSYREIVGPESIEGKNSLLNLLYVPNERLAELPYDVPPRLDEIEGGDRLMSEPVTLAPGRYIIKVDMVAESSASSLQVGVTVDDAPAVRYHAAGNFISNSYRHFPIELDQPRKVEFFHRFTDGTSDPSFKLKSIRILKLVLRQG